MDVFLACQRGFEGKADAFSNAAINLFRRQASSPPGCEFRRGVRYPQWFLLLMAVLGILSGCRSSRDLEAFAKRHREALNHALGLEFNAGRQTPHSFACTASRKPDGYNKAHLQEFGEVLQAWVISQIPGGAEGLDQSG